MKNQDLLAEAFGLMTRPQRELVATRAKVMSEKAPEPFGLIWRAVEMAALESLTVEHV